MKKKNNKKYVIIKTSGLSIVFEKTITRLAKFILFFWDILSCFSLEFRKNNKSPCKGNSTRSIGELCKILMIHLYV
jgi:hypothetical protein